MTNALAVLNLNNFMPDTARASIQAAAARWGVEYVEITKELAPVIHFWQKTFMPLVLKDYQRVIAVDADILIRYDCPNLFNEVPPAWFGCVSRVQRGFPRNWRQSYRGHIEGKRVGLKPYPTEREHLNSGVLVYEPHTHAHYLNAWRTAGETAKWSKKPFWDQGTLACVLHHYNAPVYWLPWQFNAVMPGKRPHVPLGKMAAYVYHFTRPRSDDLAGLMEKVQWQGSR